MRSGVPRFTLEEAILTALQRNPDIQRARQEIERTKGVYLELRADVLPRVDINGFYQNTDPQLGTVSSEGGGLSAVPGQYTINVEARQAIFSGGRIFSQIKSANFQRDSSYFAFRNTIDQVIATVRTQFYQVLLNRALIGVQEESVELLAQPVAGSAEPVRSRHGAAVQRPAGAGRACRTSSRN